VNAEARDPAFGKGSRAYNRYHRRRHVEHHWRRLSRPRITLGPALILGYIANKHIAAGISR